MKKGIKLVLLLLCAVLFTGVVSGCENTKVQVENLINMNAQFKGSRSITVNTGFVFEGKEDLKGKVAVRRSERGACLPVEHRGYFIDIIFLRIEFNGKNIFQAVVRVFNLPLEGRRAEFFYRLVKLRL